MKSRFLPIFAAFALLCTSCTGGFKNIRVTSCEVKSLSPSGFTKLDAEVEIGIHNPAAELHLDDIVGCAKFMGEPCLTLTAPDTVIEGRSDKVYTITVSGKLDKDFNILQIVSLIKDVPKLNDITIDLECKAGLGGVGKKIVKKDIPLIELMDKF